jgi:hypothetical protein
VDVVAGDESEMGGCGCWDGSGCGSWIGDCCESRGGKDVTLFW